MVQKIIDNCTSLRVVGIALTGWSNGNRIQEKLYIRSMNFK